MSVRDVIVVLGDQLDPASAALREFDQRRDLMWMAEIPEEAKHVWSHKARIALFLSAMRHFAGISKKRGFPLRYLRLGEHPHASFREALEEELRRSQPERVVVLQPGDYRVLAQVREAARRHAVPLDVRGDGQFLIGLDAFSSWARGRKALRLEHFYRFMRARRDVLMEDGEPVGGTWNFDKENRKSFGSEGPGVIPPPLSFSPDDLTQSAMDDVQRHFSEHPGSLDRFDWPVTPEQAEQALADFVAHRLPLFGRYQDALWTEQPFLHHSRLSAAMNLHLISPKRIVEAAVEAYQRGAAPLSSVEGFVRQILGWREFVRGIYWTHMPEYADSNALGADLPLPPFYWTGQTDMRCLAETIHQTLQYGYAHHIQRLMVTGLFALLLGVQPRQVHEWYLAVYVDAVEWAELPNTLGMSQFADGGVMGSKPYVASGKYIQRMSNYCRHCRYDPAQSTGDTACPFTTLYWDFLMRHESRFTDHPRAAMQWRNLSRLDSDKRTAIRRRADTVRRALA